jgi:hypothetical protein
MPMLSAPRRDLIVGERRMSVVFHEQPGTYILVEERLGDPTTGCVLSGLG